MFTDKWPYVVTLFISALGWVVTHTTDRLIKPTTIEYSMTVTEEGSARVATVKIFNLAQTAILRPEIIVRKLDQSADVRFVHAYIVTGLPAWVGVNTPETTDAAATFSLDTLPPGARAELNARFKGHDMPVVQFKVAEGGSAFRAEEQGWITWAVRHELEILWSTLLGWALLVGGVASWQRWGGRR